MQPVKRAVLKFPDACVREYLLMRVEEKCYRWVDRTAHGHYYNGVDYLDEATSMKALRVDIETSPEYVGVDLTIYPMDPTPAERAAKAIEFLETEEECADAIERETNLSGLLESGETLMAYLITRMAYRDMALGGLMMNYLEAVERSKKVDLSNLKNKIADTKVDRIVVTNKLPPKPGGIVQ